MDSLEGGETSSKICLIGVWEWGVTKGMKSNSAIHQAKGLSAAGETFSLTPLGTPWGVYHNNKGCFMKPPPCYD